MRAQTYLFVTLFAATTTLALNPVLSAQDVPEAKGRISDFANVIDLATEREIERRLEDLEKKTSSEIAVVTIESLKGSPVEDYANRLFKQWGVGQARLDNGVMVLVATGDREMRIEVGYGLEGVLPDGLAGQIIREEFTPRFRDGDFSGGIRNGVFRVADVVEKHQVLTPEELAKFNSGNGELKGALWVAIPFFGLFVTIGFGMVGLGLRTKTAFPVLFGTVFGGMPLVMSTAFLGRTALLTLVPWAIFIFVMGYRAGGREKWKDAFRNSGKGGGSSSGGWTMGTSGSSSGSSSSSSGSSFGGGSSGGGGASGRW
jgi:uncharacterized protein